MTATILGLRYGTHELLASLARGVQVIIASRGQKAGVLSPYKESYKEDVDAPASGLHVCDHSYFGSAMQTPQNVEEELDSLRRGRFDNL